MFVQLVTYSQSFLLSHYIFMCLFVLQYITLLFKETVLRANSTNQTVNQISGHIHIHLSGLRYADWRYPNGSGA